MAEAGSKNRILHSSPTLLLVTDTTIQCIPEKPANILRLLMIRVRDAGGQESEETDSNN